MIIKKLQKLGILPVVDVSGKIKKFKIKLYKFLLSIDVIHFFWFLKTNNREFKKIVFKNANFAAKHIVDGLGGDKNLISVKNTTYSVCVKFKSNYFLDMEILEKSGGVGIKVSEKSFFAVFDRKESRMIAKKIKEVIKTAKSNYKLLDLE